MLQITPSLWFPSLSTMAILRTMQQQMIDRAAQCLTHRVPGAQQAHAFIAHHHQRQRVDSWRWRAVSSCSRQQQLLLQAASCSDERSGVPIMVPMAWEFRTQNPQFFVDSTRLTGGGSGYQSGYMLGTRTSTRVQLYRTAAQLLNLICTVANSTLRSTKI